MSYEKFCTGCGKTFPAQADSCPHCGAACPNENPGGTLPAGLYLAERYVIGRVVEVDGEGILYEAIASLRDVEQVAAVRGKTAKEVLE